MAFVVLCCRLCLVLFLLLFVLVRPTTGEGKRKAETSKEEKRREERREVKKGRDEKIEEERVRREARRRGRNRKKGRAEKKREDRFCPACVFCCCLSRLMFVLVLPWLSFVILSFLRFVLSLSVAGLGFVLVFLLSSCFLLFWVPFRVSFHSFSIVLGVVLGLLDGLESGLDGLKNGCSTQTNRGVNRRRTLVDFQAVLAPQKGAKTEPKTTKNQS